MRHRRDGDRWEVDVRSLPPPFPLLGARAAVEMMHRGDTLHLVAAYPEARFDFPAWCRMTGNELVREEEREGIYAAIIRKAQE